MTLRFAAAPLPERSPIARALMRRTPAVVANDDAATGDDAMLEAALRHFALHGMRAAQAAAERAEQALIQGDDAGYGWWLGVCRTFDRRMASALACRHAADRN